MNESTPVPRTEARNRIIEISLNAFHKEGIKNVTMDEIAHRAGISKRTLYQIFTDKEELLLQCLTTVTTQEKEDMEKLSAQTENVLEFLLLNFELKLKKMKGISQLFFDELTKYPRVVEYIEQQRQQHVRQAVTFLERGVEQGLFLPDINFEIVYNIAARQLEYTSQYNFFVKYTPPELFLNYIFLYFRGCTTQKGAAMMDDFMKRYRHEGW